MRASRSPEAAGRRALLALAAVNVLRLAFAGSFELTPQEAYYFLYSRHLALSYFDHPPAIALCLRAFTAVLGEREMALRLCAFTLCCLLQWSFIRLAAFFLPRPCRGKAALLFCTSGLVTVASLVATPDGPLLLFWTLSLVFLAEATFLRRPRAWWVAGVCMGLAFDAKYTGLLLQLGLLLFLAASRRHRPLLRTPHPWLCLGAAQATMAPVYLWNAQHGFVSFLFQSRERASAGFHLAFRHVFALLGTQAAVYGPLLVLALGVALARAGGQTRLRDRPRLVFLLAFCLPLAALGVVLSLGTLVKPNWLWPCYVSGTLLIAPRATTRLTRTTFALAAVLHLLIAVEVLAYPVPLRSDDTWIGWRALASRVEALRRQDGDAFVFSADGYKTSAELRFYGRTKVYGPNVVGERGLQFDVLDPRPDLLALRGRAAFFVRSAPRDVSPERRGPPPPQVAARFERCEELDPLVVERRGRVLRKFLLHRCLAYRGPP